MKVALEGEQTVLGNWQEIVAMAVSKAADGDYGFAKILFDRVWPTMPQAVIAQQFLAVQQAALPGEVVVDRPGLSGLLAAARRHVSEPEHLPARERYPTGEGARERGYTTLTIDMDRLKEIEDGT